MSYNAGSIDSRLTLDRSPFTNELRAARADAAAFARDPIKIRLEIDRTKAEAELRAFEARMAMATRDRSATIKIDQSTAMQRLQQLQNRINGIPDATRKASQESEKHLSLIRTAIELLGPPLVPLAGGVLALGAGFVGMGLAGVVAFKAVTATIKEGGPEAAKYGGAIQVIKTDWGQLQDQIAAGFGPAFSQGVGQLHSALPQINSELRQSGQVLGDVALHIEHGLIGGLHTFNPLIQQAEGYIERAASAFDRWANGAGGEHFMHTLQTDLQAAIPALIQLGTLVSHILSGLNPVGLSGLNVITTLARTLNALPVPLLQAFITTYIAFRTAVAVTTGINAATLALTRFAAAETEAAVAGGAAGGGGLARTTGFLSTVGRYVGPILGVALAMNVAARATDSWRTSSDALKRTVGQTLDVFAHPLSFISRDQKADQAVIDRQQLQESFSSSPYEPRDFGSYNKPPAFNATYGNQTNEAAIAVEQRLKTQFASTTQSIIANASARSAAISRNVAIAGEINARNQQGLPPLKSLNQAYKDSENYIKALYAQYDRLRGRREDDIRGVNESKRSQEAYNVTLDSYFRKVSGRNTAALDIAYKSTAGSGLTDTSKALAAYQTQLQKNLETEQKWADVHGKATVKIGSMRVSVDAASAALAQSGGNIAKAQALLQGHAAAADLDKAAQERAATEQARIDTAVGQAQTTYKLTTDQVNLYAAALGVSAEQLGKGALSAADFVREIGMVKSAIDQGNLSMQQWVVAVTAFRAADDTAASRAQLLGAALVAFQGPALQYANTMVSVAVANQRMVTDLHNVAKGVINLKTGAIDYHNAAAAPLLNDLLAQQQAAMQAASATYQLEVAHKGVKVAAKDAADVFHNDTTVALENEMMQLGYTKKEADKLADRYFHWPKDAKTAIEALGAKDTNTVLSEIEQILQYMSGRTWNFNVGANISPDAQKVINRFGTDVNVNLNPRVAAAGAIFDAYANGGMRESHVAQIAMPGANAVRVWAEPETRGEAYIPLANDWRRPRAQAITSETARRLGGTAHFGEGGFSGAGGFTGVDFGGGPAAAAATSAAAAKTNQAVNTMLSKFTQLIQVLTQDRQALMAYGAQVRQTMLGQFNIGTSGNGYAYGIQASLHQAVSDTNKFNSLIKRARAMHLNPRLLEQLEQEGPQGAANLEAIVNAGSKYIQGINADYSKLYQASGVSASNAKRDDIEINRKIARDQEQIRLYAHRQNELINQVKGEVAAVRVLVRQIERIMETASTGARKHG